MIIHPTTDWSATRFRSKVRRYSLGLPKYRNSPDRLRAIVVLRGCYGGDLWFDFDGVTTRAMKKPEKITDTMRDSLHCKWVAGRSSFATFSFPTHLHFGKCRPRQWDTIGRYRVIKVTRFNLSEVILNADLIEFIEATPDTIISAISSPTRCGSLRSTIDVVSDR